MGNPQHDMLERLYFLLPYANRLSADLGELHTYPQDEQLHKISYPLNELVEWSCRYSNWPRWIANDVRSHSMIDAFEELKNCRNLITHSSKTLTYEETMNILNKIYQYGEQLAWKMTTIISLIEAGEMK